MKAKIVVRMFQLAALASLIYSIGAPYKLW